LWFSNNRESETVSGRVDLRAVREGFVDICGTGSGEGGDESLLTVHNPRDLGYGLVFWRGTAPVLLDIRLPRADVCSDHYPHGTREQPRQGAPQVKSADRTQIAAQVVALPKPAALGQNTTPLPRNTLFRLMRSEPFRSER
jgi:hypothetical protein